MKISDLETTAAHYQLSAEETKRCYEKWQQTKAKKSNKRQRDSTTATAVSAQHFHCLTLTCHFSDSLVFSLDFFSRSCVSQS